MNGEDLVYDWQHNVVDDPTEWAFNWKYAEGGTANPVARENRATLWIVMNSGAKPANGIKKLFADLGRAQPIKLRIKDPSAREDDDQVYEYTVIHQRTKRVIMTGHMLKRDADNPDPNVGNYAVFKAVNEVGFSLAEKMVKSGLTYGTAAFIPHSRIELPVAEGYRVVSVTGEGPDVEGSEDHRHNDGLATRFTLFHEDEEVARCHMTYEDGSYDPSLGPTIEMIAVNQSRRGEGLAKVLFYWVRCFIEENFTIECLNNDAPLKHIMIKATQIGTNEVDIRLEKDGTRVPMGFKEFLFDYCRFDVLEQKGAVAFMFASRRPKDEEAVRYIPLLAKEDLASRPATNISKAPKPGRAVMREKTGKRMCHWCTEVTKELLRCPRCSIAFYCNSTCQKSDWKRHKKWCGKTREQVRERLVKEGSMIQNPDGEWSLVMNGPGRTFGGLG